MYIHIYNIFLYYLIGHGFICNISCTPFLFYIMDVGWLWFKRLLYLYSSSTTTTPMKIVWEKTQDVDRLCSRRAAATSRGVQRETASANTPTEHQTETRAVSGPSAGQLPHAVIALQY